MTRPQTNHSHCGRYLRYALTGSLIVVALVWSTNHWVDPFNLEAGARYPGFNQWKPAGLQLMRVSKPMRISTLKPRTLILGTSRAGEGIPCSLLTQAEAPCFNASLPGATLSELTALAQHAHATAPLHRIIIGLDFAPTYQDADYIAPFSTARMHQSGQPPSPWQVAQDRLHLNLSTTASRASVRTLRSQRGQLIGNKPGVGNIANDGSWYWEYLQDMPPQERLRRERKEFLFVYQHFLHRFEHARVAPARQQRRLAHHLNAYKQLLQFAQRENITVHAFIGPYHSVYLAAVVDSGLADAFGEWKEQLTQTHLNITGATALPDYSASSEQALEAIPTPQRSGDRRWFVDSAHYTPQYGARIIKDLFAAEQASIHESATTPAPAASNTATALQRQVAAYRTANPQDAKDLQRLLQRFRQRG